MELMCMKIPCLSFLYFQNFRIQTAEAKERVDHLMADTLKRMSQIAKKKIYQMERIISGGTTRTP